MDAIFLTVSGEGELCCQRDSLVSSRWLTDNAPKASNQRSLARVGRPEMRLGPCHRFGRQEISISAASATQSRTDVLDLDLHLIVPQTDSTQTPSQ